MFQKSLYILSAFLFLAISSPTDNRREFEISRNLEIFAQVYKELNGGFVDEIDGCFVRSVYQLLSRI
jgi:hypothetical protein